MSYLQRAQATTHTKVSVREKGGHMQSVSQELSNQISTELKVPVQSTLVDEWQFACAYNDLKRIAFARLRSFPPNHSLNATMLVNEAYLKLVRAATRESPDKFLNKNAFLAAASETMRRLIIDYYRRRKSLKRFGGKSRIQLNVDFLPEVISKVDVLELNEVLERFELAHPSKALLVKLRFFAGMTMQECARSLEISIPTAERHWRYARAWLAEQLQSHS